MKPTLTIDMEGFRDLDVALGDLGSKVTARGVGRRALTKAAQPIADDYIDRLQPHVLTGALRDSSGVGTKLTRRQAVLARKSERKSFAEVYVGSGGLPQAHLQEFGTEDTPPRPSLRTAWEHGWRAALDALGQLLWDEIKKTVARAERRALKRLAKMGR